MNNIKIYLKTLFPDLDVYFDVNTDNMTVTCPILELPETALILTFGKSNLKILKKELNYFSIRIKYPELIYNILLSDYEILKDYLKFNIENIDNVT